MGNINYSEPELLFSESMRLLALTLLVFRVFLVDDVKTSFAADDLIVGRPLFDGSSYFHIYFETLSFSISGPASPVKEIQKPSLICSGTIYGP